MKNDYRLNDDNHKKNIIRLQFHNQRKGYFCPVNNAKTHV